MIDRGNMNFELKNGDGWSYYHLPSVTGEGIIHGFMTKSSDELITGPDAMKGFVEAHGASDAIIMDQEHGDKVHLIRKGEHPRRGDGLVLVDRGVIGVIKTADCLPVILYESGIPVAAIVHAGWRGTVLKIVEKAIHAMLRLGAARSRMGAIIGPGIGPCCYRVGTEVKSVFDEAGFGGRIFQTKSDILYLDLKGANRQVLEEAGIGEIHEMDACTCCMPDVFCSARRSKGKDRQINFVLL
jgi:hypothetical protein